jgi:hypothetical protein
MEQARERAWPPLLACAAVWAVVVLVFDRLAAGLDPLNEMTHTMWGTYAVTMGASMVLWIAIFGAIARLRARSPGLGGVAVIVFAMLMSLVVFGAIGYRTYFNYTVKPVQVAFVLSNLRYVLTLVKTSTPPSAHAFLVVGPLAVLALVSFVTRRPLPRLPWPRLGAFAVAGAGLIAAACGLFPSRVSIMPPDIHGTRALVAGAALWARDAELPMLPRPDRVPLEPRPATRRPDVLLIVNESVGRKQVAPWAANAGDSALARFLAAHDEHTVWFPRATTVAPVTNVAFPSLLTGLGPGAKQASFARAPLVWHDAKATGYRTALFSGQDYKYSFFGEFFLSADGPDVHRTARDLPGPQTIDSGVDDAQVADAVIAHLRAQPTTVPLLTVVQWNGSHFPCWDPAKPDEKVDPFDDAARKLRCEEAVGYIDAQLARILWALRERGTLDETLVLGTSDHGETFLPARAKRPINFQEETMGVPLFVHVPASLAASSPELVRALRENRARRVSNLDLFPTLLDLWGRWPLGADRPAITGQSLFRPIDGERILVATARGAIYEPSVQGFAMYHREWKWLLDEKKGAQLYDVTADPDELDDRVAHAPAEELRALAEELARRAPLPDILRAKLPAGLVAGQL